MATLRELLMGRVYGSTLPDQILDALGTQHAGTKPVISCNEYGVLVYTGHFATSTARKCYVTVDNGQVWTRRKDLERFFAEDGLSEQPKTEAAVRKGLTA